MENGIIQIAGIKNYDEAKMLFSAGADLVGLPLRLPEGGEDITESEAREIIKRTGKIDKFTLITYLQNPTEIVDLSNFLAINKVQIHAEVCPKIIEQLKQKNPALKIIKSLIIKQDNLNQIENYINKTYEFVDLYITDTYDKRTGAIGATGQTHNWQIDKQIVEVSPRPVILAGGLKPENVKNAILTIQPAGVDAHTGLEDKKGRKSPQLVQKFIKEVRAAYSALSQDLQKLPIDGILDLHTFRPEEVKELVPDYIQECIREDIQEIRIIHGKGKGVLRRIVRTLLSRHPAVIHFEDAKEQGGNWGATVATLNTEINKK